MTFKKDASCPTALHFPWSHILPLYEGSRTTFLLVRQIRPFLLLLFVYFSLWLAPPTSPHHTFRAFPLVYAWFLNILMVYIYFRMYFSNVLLKRNFRWLSAPKNWGKNIRFLFWSGRFWSRVFHLHASLYI